MPARYSTLIAAGLCACSYTTPQSTDPEIPDAGPCLGVNATCAGDFLRTCDGPGATVREELCTWGCDSLSAPRCRNIVPAGGGVTADQMLPASFDGIDADVSISGPIDGSNGTIDGRTATELGIGFSTSSGIAIFKFKKLSIGVVQLTGSLPIALVADGDITVNGLIEAFGLCNSAPEIAGPGGGNGGFNQGDDGSLPGGGGGGNGGGGGGWGGRGGDGGGVGAGAGGTTAGDPAISVLRGGAGGGAGEGTTVGSFRGGGGGGAIQLVSNSRIEFAGAAGINAGGCGGVRGAGLDDGGGGGAGGTILLEAPLIVLGTNTTLAANGGGGGGSGGSATDGGDGKLSAQVAVGGDGAGGGSDGGAGAAGASIDGVDGAFGAGFPNGGGGGAAGRIRLNTREAAGATTSGVISPNPGAPNSTSTLGLAVLQ